MKEEDVKIEKERRRKKRKENRKKIQRDGTLKTKDLKKTKQKKR